MMGLPDGISTTGEPLPVSAHQAAMFVLNSCNHQFPFWFLFCVPSICYRIHGNGFLTCWGGHLGQIICLSMDFLFMPLTVSVNTSLPFCIQVSHKSHDLDGVSAESTYKVLHCSCGAFVFRRLLSCWFCCVGLGGRCWPSSAALAFFGNIAYMIALAALNCANSQNQALLVYMKLSNIHCNGNFNEQKFAVVMLCHIII